MGRSHETAPMVGYFSSYCHSRHTSAGLSRVITASWLLILAPLIARPGPLQAQAGDSIPARAAAEATVRDSLAQEGGGPVSPDSADKIRALFRRPPASHPADARDYVGLPLAIVMLPLRLLAGGIGIAAAGISQVLPEGEGPNLYERMVEWGLEPSVESLGYNAGDGIQLRLTRFAPAFIEGAASVIQSPGAAYVAFGVTTEDRLTDAGAKFRRLTRAQFWGVGVDSREDDKSNYEWEQIQLGGIWEARLSDHLTFNSAAGWETNRTGLGHNKNLPDIRETFDPDSLFGSLEVVNYIVGGTKATVDFTHIDILQPRGVRFIGEAFYYGGTGSTDSDFLRLQGEVQGYIPFNQRQSFALRALVETNPGWGQGVPFYYFAELGGSEDLRGFSTARFRDRDRLTWTAEWRFEAWRELQDRSRAEWFVFWDSGTVMPSLSQITDFRNDWGFGLRFATPSGPGANFFFAWGDEGFRFGFRLISDF